MRYTGLFLASGAEGTSISIGYMGESYIDFGVPGMFVPILILGFFWGWMYAFFMSRAQSAIFGYAFATALLIELYQFEMAGIKMFGGMLMKFMVLSLALYFLEPRLRRWLEGGSVPTRRTSASPALGTGAPSSRAL